MPKEITVRQVRAQVAVAGFRTKEILLSTTLLDPVKWPVQTLVALYVRRWRVELYFDDIKTTMHAASMRCLSPAMVRRELLLPQRPGRCDPATSPASPASGISILPNAARARLRIRTSTPS